VTLRFSAAIKSAPISSFVIPSPAAGGARNLALPITFSRCDSQHLFLVHFSADQRIRKIFLLQISKTRDKLPRNIYNFEFHTTQENRVGGFLFDNN